MSSPGGSVLGVALLLLAGCGEGKSPVVIATGLDPSVPIEILLFGRSLGTFSGRAIGLEVPTFATDADGMRTKVTSPHDEYVPVLTVRVPTSCGPIEYCVGFPDDHRRRDWPAPEIRSAPREPSDAGALTGRKRPEFVCTPEVVNLLVDNRGGPTRTLTAGDFTYTVRADAMTSIAALAPACAAQARVTLDGQPLGVFPVVEDGHDGPYYSDLPGADFLIDPSGTRCYAVTAFHYGQTPYEGTGPSTDLLEKRRLHPLHDHVNYVFKPAPGNTNYAGSRRTLTQLLDSPCGR